MNSLRHPAPWLLSLALLSCGAVTPTDGTSSTGSAGLPTTGNISCLAGQKCTCSSGTCTLNCPSSGACQATCENSTCTIACAGSDSCQVTCGTGASCTQTCASGRCQLTGSGATSAKQTCNDSIACQATCASVGSCEQRAGTGPANCMGCK